MAGFYFGTSDWDDIPQRLGLTVEGGVMGGVWQGVQVEAYFTNRYDRRSESYDYLTRLKAVLDPPLGLQGLEEGEAMNRIVDEPLRKDFEARGKAVNVPEIWFGDASVSVEFGRYESNPERYRAAFDLLTSAAKIVMDRRARNPPQWELAIASHWPALGQGWNLRLDTRRGVMAGNVRGRPMSARVIVKEGAVTTHVNIAVPMPPGAAMSLTRQENGFFSRLFRGEDIIVGDPAFDAAFVIKGDPDAYVHAVLTPAAREGIMRVTQTGASITIEDGKLAAWVNQLVTDKEQLDALMKSAYSAAETLCPGEPVPASPFAYR